MEKNKLRKLELEQLELDLKEAELKRKQQALEMVNKNTLPDLPNSLPNSNGCCYPKCERSNGLSDTDLVKLDVCQEMGCKSGKKFHHVCQINYMCRRSQTLYGLRHGQGLCHLNPIYY
jgi:hypothetical protein